MGEKTEEDIVVERDGIEFLFGKEMQDVAKGFQITKGLMGYQVRAV